MAVAVATYEDVATALGRPITDADQHDQIEWWLSGIELLIVARLGPVADLDQGIVKYVEVESVAAKVRRNAQTESSITVSVDDGSITRRYDNGVGLEDITDEWWGLLSPRRESAAFSTRPAGSADPCWPHPHAWTRF